MPGYPIDIDANVCMLVVGQFVPDPAASVRVPDRPEVIAFTLAFTGPGPAALPDSHLRALRRTTTESACDGAIGSSLPAAGVETSGRTNIWGIHVYHADGRRAPGWPIDSGMNLVGFGGVSLGDLEGDGRAELLLTGDPGLAFFQCDLQAYDHRGQMKPGFPVSYAGMMAHTSVVPADADGDGDLEIFMVIPVAYGGLGYYAFDHTGVSLPNWPKFIHMNCPSSPIVADLDGDPECETVAPDGVGEPYFGFMWAYNLDGTGVQPFPLAKAGYPSPNSPAVADLDADGDTEVLILTNYTNEYEAVIDIYDLDAPYHPERSEWGTRFHDNWNTGEHGFVVPEWGIRLAGTTDGEDWTPRPETPSIHVCPNPTRGPVELRMPTGTQRAVVTIVDAGGRLVRRLMAHDAGIPSLRWDGRDEAGSEVPPGVYFVRSGSRGASAGRFIVVR